MNWKRPARLYVTWLLPIAIIMLPDLCCASVTFKVHYNLTNVTIFGEKMDGEPYLTLQPRGLYPCVDECKRRARCKSFNFVQVNRTCELFDVDSDSPDANITSAPGYRFSDVRHWGDMAGPCHQHTCNVSEKCVTDASNQALCISMECGAPAHLSNGDIEEVQFKEKGQALRFKCHPGYFALETSTTCRTDGKWTKFACFAFQTSVYGNYGILASRNYPGEYSNSDDVTYTVTLEQPDQYVNIHIEFNTESHDECAFDYVMVTYDGQKHCGQGSTRKTIWVSGSTWTVQWHTDGSVVRERGFLLEYRV